MSHLDYIRWVHSLVGNKKRVILKILYISAFLFFIAFVLYILFLFFSPSGSRSIQTNFSQAYGGISQLEPSTSATSFEQHPIFNTRYHKLLVSPLSFTVQSLWSWEKIHLQMRYFMPDPNTNVMLGHREKYPLLTIDRPFVVAAGLLDDSWEWPRVDGEGLVIYQKKKTFESVDDFFLGYRGKTNIALLNIFSQDIDAIPPLKGWLNERNISLPVKLQGSHTFRIYPVNGSLWLRLQLQHKGEQPPLLLIRTEETGDVLYRKKFLIPPQSSKDIVVDLDDLPKNLPVEVFVSIDPLDIIEEFETVSSYMVVVSEAEIVESDEAPFIFYTINTHGVSAMAHNKSALQDVVVDRHTLKVNRDNYNFIQGGLLSSLLEIKLLRPGITIGSETVLTFTKDDLLRYQFIHLPRLEKLSSLDGIDFIVSAGEYIGPKEERGMHTVHAIFPVINDYKRFDESMFTIHAFYPGTSETSHIQIIDAKVTMKKNSWKFWELYNNFK